MWLSFTKKIMKNLLLENHKRVFSLNFLTSHILVRNIMQLFKNFSFMAIVKVYRHTHTCAYNARMQILHLQSFKACIDVHVFERAWGSETWGQFPLTWLEASNNVAAHKDAPWLPCVVQSFSVTWGVWPSATQSHLVSPRSALFKWE